MVHFVVLLPPVPTSSMHVLPCTTHLVYHAACAPCCPTQERREDLLRRLLDELSALCGDLGEDVKAAVAEVHEDLVYLW